MCKDTRIYRFSVITKRFRIKPFCDVVKHGTKINFQTTITGIILFLIFDFATEQLFKVKGPMRRLHINSHVIFCCVFLNYKFS